MTNSEFDTQRICEKITFNTHWTVISHPSLHAEQADPTQDDGAIVTFIENGIERNLSFKKNAIVGAEKNALFYNNEDLIE